MSLTAVSVVLSLPSAQGSIPPTFTTAETLIADNESDNGYFIPFENDLSTAGSGDNPVATHEDLPAAPPVEMGIPDNIFPESDTIEENIHTPASVSDSALDRNEIPGNETWHAPVVTFQNSAEAAIFRYQYFVPKTLEPKLNGQKEPVHVNRQTTILRRGLNRNETTMVMDTYLYLVQWTAERQERNDLDFPIERSFQWSTQLHFRTGESFARQISLGLAFKGLSIQTNFETKTFTENETVRTETKTLKLTIPPRTQVFFYVRQWHMMTRVWFVNSWPGPMAGSFAVGNNQNPSHLIFRDIWSTIVAEENMWRHTPITGTTNIFVRPPDTQSLPTEIRPWNLYFPNDVRAALRSVGITPENE